MKVAIIGDSFLGKSVCGSMQDNREAILLCTTETAPIIQSSLNDAFNSIEIKAQPLLPPIEIYLSGKEKRRARRAKERKTITNLY